MTDEPGRASSPTDRFVRVRGAREHNLRNVDVHVPRDALVVFTGVSGSGKSSLAFGTIYAEAQRRYFESVAPYARRLIHQVGAPVVDEITGLPPAVALQQSRGTPSSRSTVGTVTTLSNSLRMLFSRAGTYPPGSTGRLDSDAFSPNTAAGACPECSGLGRVHLVTEDSLVPDASLSIRDGAIAAWPGAWHGKNLRDILVELGHDIDRPWRDLPRAERDWILFTDEQPEVTVRPVRGVGQVQRDYQGRYTGARAYVLHTLANTKSPTMRQRVLRFVQTSTCPVCSGSRLRPESLAVTVGGRNIAELAALPLAALVETLRRVPQATDVAARITADLLGRIEVLTVLGLGYLSLDRTTPTLSPGELQRLRIATQLRSGLFGVVYVLDEPSAGLHPADAEPLLKVLDQLTAAGNSLFVIEHDMALAHRADWIVDVGPLAGEQGGRVLYSGPVAGLSHVDTSVTRRFLFDREPPIGRPRRQPAGQLRLGGIDRHNLRDVEAGFPLGVFTAVTGVSGSGKSTLVSQVLADVVSRRLGSPATATDGADDAGDDPTADPDDVVQDTAGVTVQLEGPAAVDRLVRVDQKAIGRTPRSNLATYTGLFDAVRKLFAATEEARRRGYGAGRFSFNVAEGRCPTCQGEGFVTVELLFLPGTYSPCPTCHGARYDPETLEITHRGKNIAEVLDLTVDAATDFLADLAPVAKSLRVLQEVGLGYLRLGQPATELSGGEAQRVKLASELQRARRGHTLYVLDEPTTGLHPADVELLMRQLHQLVDAGNTVVVVEHDMDVVADADWVIDLGPGAGDQGGRIVAAGTPERVATAPESQTARFLAPRLPRAEPTPSSGRSAVR
ncbi:excinuclease ABC subunit A [Geodermatophilus dictyosporus]|uniref:UvrABC system protein A n=1 Tax=Geodermatophilus dictyosporus TaxID=1523247 RepID=A0A1I5JQT6_9ACTN|nr:excinuclease ABC subunit UvrA [Geodermatophilus dictyosporus]SFO75125.1 excinuclease ABC subunit A [Geodermatophilus dictyosporus]